MAIGGLRVAAVLVTFGILSAACSGDDDATSDTTAATEGPSTSATQRSSPPETATTEAPADTQPATTDVAVHVPGDDPADELQHPPHHCRRLRESRVRIRVRVRRRPSVLARRRRRPGQERGGELLRSGYRRRMVEPGPRVRGPRPLRAGGRRSRCRRPRTTRRDRGLRGRLQPLSGRHRRRRRERLLRR